MVSVKGFSRAQDRGLNLLTAPPSSLLSAACGILYVCVFVVFNNSNALCCVFIHVVRKAL